MENQAEGENIEKAVTSAENEVKEELVAQSLVKKLSSFKLSSAEGKIEVLRKSENSPLYSVKSFEELQMWVAHRASSIRH